MDNESIMKKDKLGFNGILRESFRISISNPKLLIFTLLISFPLSISLLFFEFIFQDTLLGSLRPLLSDDPADSIVCDGGICFVIGSSRDPMSLMKGLISESSPQFVLLGFMYLFVIHPLDLLNSILILCHSSALYARESLQSFGGFLRWPVKDFGFVGPLITSLYSLLLSVIVTVGLVSIGNKPRPSEWTACPVRVTVSYELKWEEWLQEDPLTR